MLIQSKQQCLETGSKAGLLWSGVSVKEIKVVSVYPQSAKERIICASTRIITEMDRNISNMFKPMI